MKRTKKIIALSLVMILILSSLSMAGCGKKKGEPVTLTLYSQTANYSGEQIGWFAKVLLDKFNVILKIVKDDEGVFTTRMESNNLGDIVYFNSSSEDYKTAVENGMLMDWNEDDLLTDNGPDIKEHMQKAIEKNIGLTESGKLYGIAGDIATSAGDHQTYFYHPDIRWDLYAAVGYPKVDTLEDLIPVFKSMKEICPTSDSGKETYAVSTFKDWDGDMVMNVKATSALYGYDEFGLGMYDCNTQTWQGCLDNGSIYFRLLRFYHDLYANDLLDPDSMTQGYDGANEDYIDGAAFWSLFTFMSSMAYNTEDHLNAGKAMYALPVGDQNTISYGLNVYGNPCVWTIGASTQYPELCMEIIDWLATPEGSMTMYYGPQGLCWDYDDSGKTILTDLGLACRNDKQTEMTGDGYSGTWSDGTFQANATTWSIDSSNPESNGETYNYVNWASYQATQNYDVLNDWRNFTGFTTPDEYLDSRSHTVSIATPYTLEARSEELDVVWQQVTQTIKDESWRAIYAESDDEYNNIVKGMVDKANEYGYADCVKFMQGQAANRKAAEDKVLAQ
jgi:putative aldouronate transport system substrate-binding protein